MKKILFITLVMLFTLSISAQTTQQSENARTAELRQKIGIAYSMPDFSTSRLDGKVTGDRLFYRYTPILQ